MASSYGRRAGLGPRRRPLRASVAQDIGRLGPTGITLPRPAPHARNEEVASSSLVTSTRIPRGQKAFLPPVHNPRSVARRLSCRSEPGADENLLRDGPGDVRYAVLARLIGTAVTNANTGGIEIGDDAANHVVLAMPECRFGGRIEVGDPSAAVHPDDAVRRTSMIARRPGSPTQNSGRG
jgi:hypothetical protein